MKKTLFLHHIFAAVIACSGILHAQEELNGNQTRIMIADEKFPLLVTGQNNRLMLQNQYRDHVVFTWLYGTTVWIFDRLNFRAIQRVS